MITSMSIGIGVAAIAMVTGITSSENGATPLIILCGVIPFLITLITSFWLGEAARFKRAGDYLCFIEFKVALILNEIYHNNIKNKWNEKQKELESKLKIDHSKLPLGRPMQWEFWLRDVGHMKSLYIFRLGLLILAFILPIILGVYYAFKTINANPFSIEGIDKLHNENPILMPWVVLITFVYFVFVILFATKLGAETESIPFDEWLPEVDKL